MDEHNEPLLTERDVARITSLSLSTIRRNRLLNLEPKFLKIGYAVRYRPEDISEWLRSCEIATKGKGDS